MLLRQVAAPTSLRAQTVLPGATASIIKCIIMHDKSRLANQLDILKSIRKAVERLQLEVEF